ncbi:MAG: FAD:protein FMN transferase [Vicinamibacterales bacterium]
MRRALYPVLAAVAVAAGCGQPSGAPPVPPAAARVVVRSHDTMGTRIELTASTADSATAERAFAAVFADFDRLDSLLSVWKPESEVVRLNAAAGLHPVPVSAETREVLRIARQVSEWTDGAFDVTFGALTGLWKFDAQDKDGSVPDPREVATKLPLVNYRALVVDDAGGTAFLQKAGMKVHLGGIGKGYAVDRAAGILRSHGLRDFMIQAGGDLYVGGFKDGRPWKIGLRDPRGPIDAVFATLQLTDGTSSTSGDYERFFIRDGRRYHHILDLSTGEPARRSRSVTLVTNKAVIADALAKGVFILGPVRGLALVERLPDVEAVIVGADNEVVVSSGLRGKVAIAATPTDAP